MSPKRILLNIWRYGRHPKSALIALRTLCEYRIVKNSSLLDKDWILAEYGNPNDPSGDPVLNYMVSARVSTQTSPSPFFCDQEYREIHKLSPSTLPIVHYELFGKRSGAVLSHEELQRNHGRTIGYGKRETWSLDRYSATFPRTIANIRQRVQCGKKIRVGFFVFTPSMFPARPLLDQLLSDANFTANVIVIPDLRWSDIDPNPAMDRCYQELKSCYGGNIIIKAKTNADGTWPDVTENYDIVCYPTPYDLSNYHYNPRWAIGREFLPIQVNYTLSAQNYGLKLFSLFNQAVFWKTFFESQDLLDEFKDCMMTRGRNCPITGYIKMDPLAGKPQNDSPRKCLIIAPHHSIAGGYNDMLSLSNFLQYANYFKSLPDKHPEIDFVFRPHPFLLQALKQDTVWGTAKTDKYFSELCAHDNMRLSTEGDYLALFAKSDGIIQDCCSFLVEYFYTGKPQCYMLKSPPENTHTFLPFGIECLNHCYQAFSTSDMDNFITDVIINGRDSMRESRDKFRSRIMVNYPNAASTALNLIKSELGLLTAQ